MNLFSVYIASKFLVANMLVIHFCLLFLLSFQVFADESLLELRGKVEGEFFLSWIQKFPMIAHFRQLDTFVFRTRDQSVVLATVRTCKHVLTIYLK